MSDHKFEDEISRIIVNILYSCTINRKLNNTESSLKTFMSSNLLLCILKDRTKLRLEIPGYPRPDDAVEDSCSHAPILAYIVKTNVSERWLTIRL